MSPADYFYIVTASCFLVVTLLLAALLIALLVMVLTIRRKVRELRFFERLAVVSPWAPVVSEVANQLFRYIRERKQPEPPPEKHP
jgi:hypothetical protein